MQTSSWVYYRLWPNLAFDVYPEQMDFMQFIPISAEKTLIRELPYALPDERREVQIARYLNWRINRQVNAEDTDLISRVQDGMGTSGFSSGPRRFALPCQSQDSARNPPSKRWQRSINRCCYRIYSGTAVPQ